jgi:hypothetical protein
VLGIDTTGAVDSSINFFAYGPQFSGGVNVAAGDIDGDGAIDLVTGAGPGGPAHVRVFTTSGSTTGGHTPTLHEAAGFIAYHPSFSGGVSVAVGDVTGDGVPDIVTGAGPGGGPHVRIFTALPQPSMPGVLSIVEHTSFFAYDPAFRGGVRVAVGDLDGDGVAEIITTPGAGGGPHVVAFSVTDPGAIKVVSSFFAYDPAFTGGIFVAAGDVDGDGCDEIITGAGAGGGPHVIAFRADTSRLTVSVLASFFAYDPFWTGGVRVGAGDLDGDGRAEILTGSGPGGGPHVTAVRRASDGTLSLAASFFAYHPAFSGGVFVGGATR